MAELWLVCEGEPDSVDVTLLQQIFTQVLGAEIVVEPACGSQPSPVARFLQNRRGGTAAFVHDRDYRPRAHAEAAFGDGTPGFFWRRHSIENYLLPPPILLRAFQNLRERFEHQRPGQLPSWMTALPTRPDEAADILRACARERAAEEACRLATYRLWEALPPEAMRVQKRVPSRHGSDDPSDWREALCQEAERLRRAAEHAAGCPNLERDAIIQLFDAVYSEVTELAYVQGMEFLIDFHGRDLLTAFTRSLAARGFVRSYKNHLNDLIPAAVQQYGDDRTIYRTDDFLDLANGVRSLVGPSRPT